MNARLEPDRSEQTISLSYTPRPGPTFHPVLLFKNQIELDALLVRGNRPTNKCISLVAEVAELTLNSAT